MGMVALRCEGGPHHGRVLTLDEAAVKAVLPPHPLAPAAEFWRATYVRDGDVLLFQDWTPRAVHWLPAALPEEDDDVDV